MIAALIFDFDGLILDTETAEIRTWQNIYAEFGYAFPQDEFIKTVGGYGLSTFDAAAYLHGATAGSLNEDVLRARFQRESGEEIRRSPVLPGVIEIIAQAKARRMRLAVASSSPHAWVDAHLTRLGLLHSFDRVICGDDVGRGRTKPKPDLFLRALEQLRVQPPEALIFEDSPNGVAAANSAGIPVVLVTNPTTAQLPFRGDYLELKSLADRPLADLLAHFEMEQRSV